MADQKISEFTEVFTLADDSYLTVVNEGTPNVNRKVQRQNTGLAKSSDLSSHVLDTGNPHAVTALQAGADPAGSASAVQDALDLHTGDSTVHYEQSAISITLSQVSDSGSAAAADVGVGAGNVVQLDGTARLPAVDGSQLTGLPSGVSDHGALTGLADDDHTQYYNQARGDARYSQLGHTHNLATDVTGVLAVANGGTGQTALSSVNAADLGAGASSDGQVLTSDGAGGAAWEAIPTDTTSSVAISRLDIDGGTDIGTALADADLLIVDDGGAGTNRKSAVSRIWTYIRLKLFPGESTVSGTSGALSIDWSTSRYWKQGEPTGAITYTFTNPPPDQCHVQLRVLSDGTSTAQTFTWPASVKWVGATWAATANKNAVIAMFYDGTNYWAQGANEV